MARAAVAQMCSTGNKVANLQAIAKCAGLAKKFGASMLLLPECCAFMGENSTQTLANAEPLDDHILQQIYNTESSDQRYERQELLSALQETVQHFTLDAPSSSVDSPNFKFTESDPIIIDSLKSIAKVSGLWISAGGIHEKISKSEQLTQDERVYNTHLVMDSNGEIVAKYRKIHLFDVSIPSQNVLLQESKTTAPGKSLQVCDSPLGKLGLTTCYDIRFPEQYMKLTQEMGAQVLLVPSAFTVPTGRAHWHVLLRARAIETQCYVLASAQFGSHNAKRTSYGHSLAVDPWGSVIADAGGMDSPDDSLPTSPSIIVCDVDHQEVTSVRERMPIQLHRRTALLSEK